MLNSIYQRSMLPLELRLRRHYHLLFVSLLFLSIRSSTSRSLTSDDWGRLASSGSEDGGSLVGSLPCVESTSCHGRAYGTRPEDVAQYGNISPCRFHGWVRCIESNEMSNEPVSNRLPARYYSYQSPSRQEPINQHPAPQNFDHRNSGHRFDSPASPPNADPTHSRRRGDWPDFQQRPEPLRSHGENSHPPEFRGPVQENLQSQRMPENPRVTQSNQLNSVPFQQQSFGPRDQPEHQRSFQPVNNFAPQWNQPTQPKQPFQPLKQQVDLSKKFPPSFESRSFERLPQTGHQNPSSHQPFRESQTIKQWPSQPLSRPGTPDQQMMDPPRFNEISQRQQKPLLPFSEGNQHPLEAQQRPSQHGNPSTEVVRQSIQQMNQQPSEAQHQRSGADANERRQEFLNTMPSTERRSMEQPRPTAPPQPVEQFNAFRPPVRQVESQPKISETQKPLQQRSRNNAGPTVSRKLDEAALQPTIQPPQQVVEPAKSPLERLLEMESQETQQELAALIRALAVSASRGNALPSSDGTLNRSPTSAFESNVVPFIPFADPLPLEPPSNALF